jgi:hypothetical protein
LQDLDVVAALEGQRILHVALTHDPSDLLNRREFPWIGNYLGAGTASI